MILCLLFVIFASIINKLIGVEYIWFLILYVIYMVFTSLFMQLARGLGKNSIYAIASFISATSTVLFNILLLAIIRIGLYGLFIATISAQIITIMYLCIAIKPWLYFKLNKIDIDLFKTVAKYSIPLIPNELSWWVVNVSDRTIISYVLGVSINGIYTVANKFSNLFISFYNIFNLSWTETVSLHYSDDDGKDFLCDVMSKMFKLFSCACFGIVAIMPLIFPWLINEKYSEAYNQIIILLYAMLLRVMVGLYSSIYIATKESAPIACTTLIAALINITVNLLFIYKIGLYSASISTAVAFGILAIIRALDINRKFSIKINAKVIISTAIIACVLAITYYMNIFIINLVMLAIVCIYSIIVNRDILHYFYRKIKMLH